MISMLSSKGVVFLKLNLKSGNVVALSIYGEISAIFSPFITLAVLEFY